MKTLLLVTTVCGLLAFASLAAARGPSHGSGQHEAGSHRPTNTEVGPGDGHHGPGPHGTGSRSTSQIGPGDGHHGYGPRGDQHVGRGDAPNSRTGVEAYRTQHGGGAHDLLNPYVYSETAGETATGSALQSVNTEINQSNSLNATEQSAYTEQTSEINEAVSNQQNGHQHGQPGGARPPGRPGPPAPLRMVVPGP